MAIPPQIKIDHLKITSSGIEESVDCAALIEGLLWVSSLDLTTVFYLLSVYFFVYSFLIM